MKVRSVVCAALASLVTLAVTPSTARAADRQHGRASHGYIVVYKPSVPDADAETDRHQRARNFRARHRYGSVLKGFAANLSEAQVRELEQDPDVAFVSPDRPVRALGSVPVAAGETVPTGVRRLEAASATAAHEASGANVGVIDTGVDLDHPDLNVANGTNCVSPGAPADDDNGHGTHVAGSVAAHNSGAGVVGAAPGTKVLAVKVLDSGGGGSWSGIICGIDWVTATRADADPSNDVAVVNMSLGGVGDPVKSCTDTTDALHKAICNSTAAGVSYVVAAGNDGWDFDYASAPDVPAAYPEVLTVTAASDSDGRPGATGANPACATNERDDRYASFSNYALTAAGRAHTIAGPGVCIRSTWPGGGHNTISGTSMATPHVAGAVALCLNDGGASGPCAGLTPAQVVQKLRSDAEAHAKAEACDGFTGDPLHPVGSAYFGHLAWVGVAGGDAPGVARCQPLGYGLTGSIYGGTGHISRLYENDGNRMEVSGSYSGGAYVADLRPYATLAPSQRATLKKLTVDYDGHATTGTASVTIRIYNFVTNTWQTIDGPRTGVTSDRSLVWSTSTPGSYVSSTGEVRLSVLARGSGSFRSRTDMVRFTVEN